MAWVPVDMSKPIREVRPFTDITGARCYQWRFLGQPDRGGWMTADAFRMWRTRHGAKPKEGDA